MMPKISVVIPTFNRAETIERAIDSVLNQTYNNFELLVVDDGSTDETEDIISNYPDIKYLKQENSGVASARNLGIKNSTGDYIAFLDSDDEWIPDKLLKQINFFDAHPEFEWVHSNEIWIRLGSELKQLKKHRKGGGDQFIPSLDLCLISPSCVLIKKEILSNTLFREDFEVCEDYDLWLRLLLNFPIGFIEEPLVHKYGGHADQLSTKFFAMDSYRIKTIHWILTNANIKGERLESAQEVFNQKHSVLLKGAIKHNNKKLLEELNSYF